MLPRLDPEASLHRDYGRFLDELEARGFRGEVSRDHASRLVASTDNSVYQILPQAVVFPRDREDVLTLARVAGEARFRSIKLSPRGGGTGTNGQALCNGVIVDLSRNMRTILELDLEQGWVRVQPGVVLAQLNAFLKPHGVFFAPHVSPANRATVGGMVNTDACGKGSRVHGRTSDHIVELEVVLIGGARLVSRRLTLQELAAQRRCDDVVGHAYRTVDAIVTQQREQIEAQFPKLQRFLTGYNLAHVYSADRSHFNLSYLVAGSEGTLGFVTEAKFKLTPLPKARGLVAIRYTSFDAALRAAARLVLANPSAIETVDDTIVALAKKDPAWASVAHVLDRVDETPLRAINLVEFEADSIEAVDDKLAALGRELDAGLGREDAASAYTLVRSRADIEALWSLRSKAVGLLGARPGDRRPIAFVEDTAVPPERLADYIQEFRALLDEHGLHYGMFGHVDVGCLHVRPALNLRDERDEALLRPLSDKVAALVKSYGGIMWSEHGKGFRSEYSPIFFGAELYQELRKIKEAFDPHNQLNPGKLAVPVSRNDALVSVDATKRSQFDREIGAAALKRYDAAVNCNGNGECFDWNPDTVMCPSAKITQDRVHSPKGRSSIMREWLRLSSRAGFDLVAAADRARTARWPARGRRNRACDANDFSHQVYDAMNGCLACKACATQCPLNVDVPSFRSEFFALYHTRYARPARDYFVAGLELALPRMGVCPRLFNSMLRARWFRSQLEKRISVVHTPLLSEHTVAAGLRQRGAPRYGAEQMMRKRPQDHHVLLLQDAFTTFYEAHIVLATYDLLSEFGYKVWVLPFFENGKGLHLRGFLRRFKQVVKRNRDRLAHAAALGIPMIGIEPAVTLTYRDEYCEALQTTDLGFEVKLLQEWLCGEAPRLKQILRARGHAGTSDGRFELLQHCIERTSARGSRQQWQSIFEAFGLELELPALGCCGMCGVYGHEAEHYEYSRGIFSAGWARHLPRESHTRRRMLATGHSCRNQVKRFAGFAPRHPCEVLLERLRSRPDAARSVSRGS